MTKTVLIVTRIQAGNHGGMPVPVFDRTGTGLLIVLVVSAFW